MSQTLVLVLRTLPNLLATKSTDSSLIASVYLWTIVSRFLDHPYNPNNPWTLINNDT